MRVGFIGLGSQGAPMARRIVEGGYELTLWARRPASVEPYADTAAKVAATPAELAAASDLVCLCVVGDDDVRQVLTGETGVLAGLAPGGDHRHSQHRAPRHLLARSPKLAARQGVSVIDAPVSGGGPAAADGTLLVMVGGDEADVEKVRPVFATYADPVVHLGPLGSGQVAKILNNLLFSANLGSAMSALELGDALGVAREQAVRGARPRLGHQQGGQQHLDVRRHSARGWRPSPERCCRRTSATRPASRPPRRRRRDRCSPRPTPPWNTWIIRGDATSVSSAQAGWARRWCARLVAAGHTCARSAGRPRSVRRYGELGAHAGRRSGGSADGADVVVVCVFTDEQVRQLCLDGDLVKRMRPGATLVLHTTGSPRTAQAIAGALPHVEVVDAPVSGGPHDIAAGCGDALRRRARRRGGPR